MDGIGLYEQKQSRFSYRERTVFTTVFQTALIYLCLSALREVSFYSTR